MIGEYWEAMEAQNKGLNRFFKRQKRLYGNIYHNEGVMGNLFIDVGGLQRGAGPGRWNKKRDTGMI